jgi:hypothetical protein
MGWQLGDRLASIIVVPATHTAGDLISQLSESKDKRVRAAARLVGRPMALTPARAERILSLIILGLNQEQACEAVAITARTLQKYKARAAEFDDIEDVAEVPEPERLLVQFVRLLKLAESRAEVDLLRMVREGGRGWQAYMTILERRWPKRWGRSEKRIHEGGDKPIRQDVSFTAPPAERRKEVAQILDDAEALKEKQDA